MNLALESIVQYAAQNGKKLVRGAISPYDENVCLLTLFAHHLGKENIREPFVLKMGEVYGISPEGIESLEAGFEGWTKVDYDEPIYYELGAAVYEASRVQG
jgi:hypothetical protein